MAISHRFTNADRQTLDGGEKEIEKEREKKDLTTYVRSSSLSVQGKLDENFSALFSLAL